MKNNKKDIKIIISSILIIISFFMGYYFAKNSQKISKNTQNNYINLDILKTKIKINKSKNITLTINGKEFNNLEYKLK